MVEKLGDLGDSHLSALLLYHGKWTNWFDLEPGINISPK